MSRCMVIRVAAALLAASISTVMAQSNSAAPVVVEVAQAAVSRVAPHRWVPGGVVSRDDARLATSAAGRLEFVAEVGTRVRAGERVAKLEDAAMRLRVEDTAAEVVRVESLRAASQRQLQRIETLANNSISQTQLDEVRSQLAVLSAQLQQAQVRHKAALHDLEQTELRTPFPGIVTERLVQRGEYVAAGASVARVVDTVHLEARVQAPLALAEWVRPAMSLPIKFSGRRFNAKVRTVVPVGDARSRQFELRLALDDSSLAVGSAVEIGLPEQEPVDTLTVPRDAIVIREAGSYLMRVRADGIAERVPVTAGLAGDERVAVKGALAPGESVVVRGAERLQSGQRVLVHQRANRE